jgi:leucyl/phenylalanyl-tRNA--protein transferase
MASGCLRARHFPWPLFDNTDLLAWWSPDPRAILEFDDLIVPRRLRRTLRSGQFTATCNTDFAGVLHGCATAQDRRGNTWLMPPMIEAYQRMHQLGHAHSVEVWQDDQLVGGTYGMALGGFFAAESKFYYVRDASKVAVIHLVAHLKARGYQLLDIQQLTEHTRRLGAKEIPRHEYLRRLAIAQQQPVTFGDRLEAADAF